MMIKIHGFPAKTKYQDVKILIKQECQITDFILDNLVIDTDGTKKVRIGLTDNSEGYRLMKSLDGYRMPGNYILKATPVSKAASNLPQQNAYDSRPGYQNQQTNNYSNAPRNDYMGQLSNDYNQGPHGAGVSHGLQATGMHGPGGSLGPRASLGGPGNMDTMNRLSPWASSGNNSNSWNSNPAMGAQVPQNSFGYNNQQANMNTGFGQQHQHHSDHLKPFSQGRGPPEQSFGYTPKNNVPDAPTRPVNTRHALRSIETVDTSDTHPPIHGRYPQSQSYQQDKPVTIMKDNFQGPTQYNLNNPEEHAGSHQSQYQSQAAPSPWQSQTQSTKSQYSKPSPTPYDKKYDDRKYSQLDSRDSKNQPLRPETQDRPYKDYEKRQGFSPRRSLERRVSPSGRKASPSRRRVSPSGRRISPHSRKFSPTGKGVAPDWRTIPSHQTARHDDPHKRASPSRRLVSPSRRASPSRRPSPGRRDSPRLGRYSSDIGRSDKLDKYGGDRLDKYGGDRLDKYGSDKYEPEKLAKYGADKYDKYGPDKSDKYGEDKLKQVRPAYEPKAHASNQDIYSGGYRSDTRENTQYPIQGMREVEQRVKSWQRDRKEAAGHMKKQDSDRREIGRMHMERDRLVDPVVEAKNTLTTQRKSRSPMRRDRSPLRDRYKRQSPSTHSSRSPSRAWAQEKRRTSEIRDAPPPPTWPGKNVRDEEYSRSSRSNFPDRNKVEKTKHVPVWELNKDEDPRDRRPENIERRSFVEDNIRHTKGMPMREPLAHPSQSERFPQREREREPKFSPREDYDADRRDNYRRRDISPDRKPLLRKEDYESARRPREHEERPLQDDYHRRREASPRYDSRNDVPVTSDIDKDFEDIYKRALLFKKKAAELRRLSKKRDEFEEDDRSRIHHSEREGDDSERSHRFDDRDRFRDEEVMRSRERDDRARDERPHERSRLDDAPRRADYRPREDFSHQSDRNDDRLKRFTISPSIRIKRDKAIDDIANRIIDRHENYRQLQGEQRARVLDELKLAVARIVFDMFGDNDVSFIEIIIKFQAKYTLHDEEKILQDVMSSLPSQFRTIKRQGPEVLEVPIKTRRSQSPNLKPEPVPRPKLSDSRWHMNIVPPEVVTMPVLGVPPAIPPVMNQSIVPMMVPAPYIHPYEPLPQDQVYVPEQAQYQQTPTEMSTHEDIYKLFLCKDDFDLITTRQADLLKSFLISQIFKESEVSQGWAPDFTFKGLQSPHRYEMVTKDDSSRDWLINLDFSEFTDFNVLVYTKEELWYERAAVWLPGHSRSRNIEPLEKLKLQNKKLEGVNVHKWKFVKKIVNQKGTRLYVDMPPSSARALEKHKMMLSYELQKVNVFLKAVAVDKDAFDAGLKELSVTSAADITTAVQNSPMPSLTYDQSIVKITLNGCKSLSLMQARKIKEVIIYHLFRYHQQDGNSRTDFLKYGFFPPNCFGVVPQNPESKKWLLSQHLGKVNRQVIVVLGGDEENTRFFKMTVVVPNENQINPAVVAERLKQSNQGVKGINFNIWKPVRFVTDRKKAHFEIDIDLESVETLSKMQYQLDYLDHIHRSHTVYFKSEYSESKLEELLEKYKAEMTDHYDVANMDLESDYSDDEVICLD